MIFLVNLWSVQERGSNYAYWELGSSWKNKLNWHYSCPSILIIDLNSHFKRNSKLNHINRCPALRAPRWLATVHVYDTSTALKHLSWARNATPGSRHTLPQTLLPHVSVASGWDKTQITLILQTEALLIPALPLNNNHWTSNGQPKQRNLIISSQWITANKLKKKKILQFEMWFGLSEKFDLNQRLVSWCRLSCTGMKQILPVVKHFTAGHYPKPCTYLSKSKINLNASKTKCSDDTIAHINICFKVYARLKQ